MANFSYNPPTDFLKQLGRLGEIEKVAPMMVDESIPIVRDKLQKEVAYHVRTGSLQASIRSTKAKKLKSGAEYACAMPTGKDENGVRNMEKFAYLEFGTSKQAATPVISTVLGDTEGSVENKMAFVFRREMSKK